MITLFVCTWESFVEDQRSILTILQREALFIVHRQLAAVALVADLLQRRVLVLWCHHYKHREGSLTWLIHFLTLLAAARVLPTIPVAHPAGEKTP